MRPIPAEQHKPLIVKRRETMKRYPIPVALAVLVLVILALAGCGGGVTQTTEGGMTDTTIMSEETTTTMVDTTATTMTATTATSPRPAAPSTTTSTTQSVDDTQGMAGTQGMGGPDIPMAQPGSYTDLTPQQAKELIDTTPDLVIIDVSPHYDEGHLPGAISYYLGDGSLEKAIPTLDRDVPYLVYCHVDAVAIAGAEALVDAGFAMVYRLEGNYSGWLDAGYPVER
jgi:rhodanese-related sulfurtransferase